MAYLGSGFIEKARNDLNKAYEVTNGKDQNVIKALHELKEKVAKNKVQEKELVKKMLLSGGLYKDQV
jgi:SPX domain protein involved in polyphosphate accumulation